MQIRSGVISSAFPRTTTPRGSAKEFAAGDALQFTADEHYDLLTRASVMEKIVTGHFAAIEEAGSSTQPEVKLVVDEWGAWYGGGTRLGPEYNLSQQNTVRDALLAGITLDIFQKHADKVGAACVAQTINCLHSLMMAKDDQSFLISDLPRVQDVHATYGGEVAARGVLRCVHR